MEVFGDGAIVYDGGVIIACGDYSLVAQEHRDAELLDRRDCYLLPGFVDTHVHYPQLPVIGAMGLTLLDWLEQRTLPHEAAFDDPELAHTEARAFLKALAANGTTTALVFGAHFLKAMDVFFEVAERSGLRICAGLTVSDRMLTDALHVTPEQAARQSVSLIERWHRKGRLKYAVTPRFALSCSDDMLAACGEVLAGASGLLLTSHVNETADEVAKVAELFTEDADYLAVYERHGLVGERTVLAHNVHASDSELNRLAGAGATVAHCPSSNMFIGSGLFPLKRHLAAGVRVSLGTDVGGGTGFSMLKEGLAAYEHQMLLQAAGTVLGPAHLLYLATRAGACALGLGDQVGDLSTGRQADFILLKPPDDGTLAQVLRHSRSADDSLAGLFTLAREEAIAEVYVAGELIDKQRFEPDLTPLHDRDG